MLTHKQVEVLKSVKVQQKFHENCVQGDNKHFTLCKESVKADVSAEHLGLKQQKHKKQINIDIEKDHADMEQIDHKGDHEDSGDGDSQEQE